jgi:NADH:ubiquinone oxidoreductase subunit 6 (subunit J)
MHTLLFNLYASLALTAGLGVIISKNPVHSVIFLILVFCNATGLLLLFKIELLAMMFIIIYVGAIAVLFLFVVMMLNIKINENNAYTKKIINQENKLATLGKIIQAPIIMSSLSFITVALILGL